MSRDNRRSRRPAFRMCIETPGFDAWWHYCVALREIHLAWASAVHQAWVLEQHGGSSHPAH